MDTGFDWKKWRAQLIVIVLAAGVGDRREWGRTGNRIAAFTEGRI